MGCDLYGVYKFSQVVLVVPWYLPLQFGRVAEVSLRSIHLWIGNDKYNFTKIAAILNFHVNMPPSWILCVFGPFLKKLFSSFMCITAQYKVIL